MSISFAQKSGVTYVLTNTSGRTLTGIGLLAHKDALLRWNETVGDELAPSQAVQVTFRKLRDHASPSWFLCNELGKIQIG